MKPKIAPEIDSMMWAVAEDGNPRAVAEFEQRFPDLKAELAKRLAMVRSLRGAGGSVEKAIPRFKPAATAAPLPAGPKWPWIAAAAAIAATGFATYAFVANREPQPSGLVKQIPTTVPSPSSGVVYSDSLPTGYPKTTPKIGTEPSNDPAPTPSGSAPLPPYLQPQQFQFSNTKLASAIRMACLAGRLEVEIAPGLPDVSITKDYTGYTPVQVLQALGDEYGFTPLEDGPRRVLIIPAKDDSGAPRKLTIPEGSPQP